MRKEKGKDPAFLLYGKDWLTGTFFLTYDQKGRLIDLLCHQHVNDGLTLDDIMKVLEGVVDEQIISKFEESEGKLYNRKLKRVTKEREEHAIWKAENGRKGGLAKANNKQSSSKDPSKTSSENLSRALEEEDEEEESKNNSIESKREIPNHLFTQETLVPVHDSLDDLYNDIN